MAKETKVYDENGEVVVEVYSIKRKGNQLIIDGKALGVMRMDMIFPLEEFFNGLRIALCWGVISFILLLPYFGLRHLYHSFRKRLYQK